ncbi:MAG: carboxypeptidase-like regulatory domain-containing protein [Cryomorphaceae bacterium]|nr:carboxypeptidase-like regulatory domain-containing protein [Cryomorphaceae bacterium]
MSFIFRLIIVVSLVFSGSSIFGQSRELTGTVFNLDGRIIENVHVVNPNTSKGTITNHAGHFRIRASVDDTLVFSVLSYEYYYHKVSERDFENPMRIFLTKQNYLLEEVSIYSYKLSTNQPRPMRFKKPTVPDNEDIRNPRIPPPAGAGNPIEAIYQAFDKRLKQLKILETYKQRDEFQEKLEEGNNRDILIAITGMNEREVKPFLMYCRMGPDFINSSTDYELLTELLSCFRSYIHQKDMFEIISDHDWD